MKQNSMMSYRILYSFRELRLQRINPCKISNESSIISILIHSSLLYDLSDLLPCYLHTIILDKINMQ